MIHSGVSQGVGQETALLTYARWQQGIRNNVLYVVILVAV
jgi:hypothetical protein